MEFDYTAFLLNETYLSQRTHPVHTPPTAMHHALVASARHELSGLCAACARKRLATSALARASASSAGITHSTRRRLPVSQQSLRAASPRRWLSISATSRAPQQAPADNGQPPSSSPPKPDDTPLPYYALFPQTLPDGPPPTGPFEIDTRALRREFLQLQAASHPDFHHSAGSSSTQGEETTTSSSTTASSSSSSPSSSSHSISRRKAEALSSHINAAYKTLSDPLARAQYLLAARHGVDLAGDEAARLTGPPDPSLLIDVLHARETIEEAASEADLAGVRAENDARIEACLGALAAAFARGDVAAAVRETVRLRYWVNIRESVDNWEEGRPVVLQH